MSETAAARYPMGGGITGATRLAAVIGSPVRHSLSPAIHNAAYAATGLDWVFLALEVPPGRGADAVRAVPVLGLGGLSVTMPHKDAAAQACDELSADATALRTVNTVVPRSDGSLYGDSTDGEGFVRSLDDAGLDLTDRAVLVIGAGGAARAVALAAGRRGARLTIAARRADAAAAAAALAPGGRAIGVDALADAVAEAAVVVNATPVGMGGERLLAPGALGPGQWAVDLVYHPAETPFLLDAAAAGATTVGGLGMLVHQAALAFEQVTGVAAPLEVMARAAAGT
jgi:shikimate dehydrogenase